MYNVSYRFYYLNYIFNMFRSGALTKGDRRAATGADMSEFNFDTPYGRNALKQMYLAICQVGPMQNNMNQNRN